MPGVFGVSQRLLTLVAASNEPAGQGKGTIGGRDPQNPHGQPGYLWQSSRHRCVEGTWNRLWEKPCGKIDALSWDPFPNQEEIQGHRPLTPPKTGGRESAPTGFHGMSPP